MSRAAASSDAFHAVADPTRRAILDQLRAGSAPVTEIAANFKMSRPAVSKHLRVLREARLVTEKRDGRLRVYELTPGPLLECAHWLEQYRHFWQVNLLNLKRHVESKK
ncbi:MAG: ArsR family transcriptional regulator [Myxococcales bacterium]|nr:MAG: ArsR family transcriptional regulator [Myxococcales bacterium]